MLERIATPALLIGCGCNAAFALIGGFAVEEQQPVIDFVALFGGALSFLVAMTIGIIILWRSDGPNRSWIKSALVFLILGPLAFWGLQWPAGVDTICIARDCYSEVAVAFRMRAMGDVLQSQTAMIAVALAALFCAARAITGAPRGLAT